MTLREQSAARDPRRQVMPHLTADRVREAEDDLLLIERVRGGDQVAFRTLVDRYQRRAWRIAMTMVKDETEAQEIVQEAFVRVFKSVGSFEGKSSFFTWLYRIIHNIAFDMMARNRRWHVVGDETTLDDDSNRDAVRGFMVANEFGDPDAFVNRAELRERLEKALEALPPMQRSALLMKEVEGMTHQEIAEAQGVPMGTVMSRLFNARIKLKKSLSRTPKKSKTSAVQTRAFALHAIAAVVR